MTRLGETIRAARVKAKMTPKALARKCGVSESFVNEVELGRRILSDDQAQRMLKVLGVKDPISNELAVANEPEQAPRPRPRPYVMPLPKEDHSVPTPQEQSAAQESADAWLDALGGVVKRVPVMGADGVVIDHRLLPVIGGRIEGGAPDKVLYFRVEDDDLRGFRIHAGDLLLTVPAATPVDDAIMLVAVSGNRMVRKIKKLEGGKLLLQTYDHALRLEEVELKNTLILGRCIRLEAEL